MKTTAIALLCPLLAAGLLRGQDEPAVEPLPELPGAHVTIPYSELKSLWEAARKERDARQKPTAPPVPAAILAADYQLDITERSTLVASYRVQTLTDGWHLVPLLGGDARLTSGEEDGPSLLWRDERYQLLTRGPGVSEVTLRFSVPRPELWSEGLRLAPGESAMNRLQVSGIPAGKTVRVKGLPPGTPTETGELTYHLPGDGREVVLTLDSFRAPEPVEAPAPPTPSAWDIQSEVFARYHEGRVRYQARIYCRADDGSGLEIELLLPRNVTSVAVAGEDLDRWRLGSRQDNLRPLQVSWTTRDQLDRILDLTYEIPQSPLAETWMLTAPRVAGDRDTKSLFAILPVDGLELTGDSVRDSVQSRRLPAWLREQVGSNDFLTAEAEVEVPLNATWLPRLETAQAMVSTAAYESRLVQDGALLVKATYSINHQSPLAWRLDLPEMDEILTCEVEGKAAQPVKRGENQIEFNLTPNEEGTSTVSFCYTARLEAMDRVSGRSALELPRTDLFIHRLNWRLSIPTDYATTALEGNVSIDRNISSKTSPPGPAGSVVELHKELVRGEHPAVELYYERRALSQ